MNAKVFSTSIGTFHLLYITSLTIYLSHSTIHSFIHSFNFSFSLCFIFYMCSSVCDWYMRFVYYCFIKYIIYLSDSSDCEWLNEFNELRNQIMKWLYVSLFNCLLIYFCWLLTKKSLFIIVFYYWMTEWINNDNNNKINIL